MKRNALTLVTIFLLLLSGAAFAEDARTADREVRYEVTKLNSEPKDTTGYFGNLNPQNQILINNRGQVVWHWVNGFGLDRYRNYRRIYLWQNGQVSVIAGEKAARPLRDFNDAGQISTWQRRVSPAFTEEALIREKDGWPKYSEWYQLVLLDTEGNVHYIGEEHRSVVWRTPSLREQSEHCIFYPLMNAVINNQGTVACGGFAPERRDDRGRLYSNGRGLFLFPWDSPTAKNIDLTPLAREMGEGVRRPYPTAINDLGNVVGATDFSGSFIWWKEEDRVERITPLEDSCSSAIRNPGWLCEPTDINDRNQIVGNDLLEFYEIGGVKREGRPFGVKRAWIWQDGRISQLPVLAPNDFSEKSYNSFDVKEYKRFKEIGPEIVFTQVYAINNSGQAVGDAGLYYGDQSKGVATTAVIWENGEVKELNSLVPPDTPHLYAATDTNDYGQIVASGEEGGVYLLTPISLLDGKSVAELDLPGKPKMEKEKESELVAKSD